MAKGTVKWFDSRKGYGFILPDGDEENEIFVHYSGIVGDDGEFKKLRENQPVEYEVRDGEKGQEAFDVTVVVE